MKKIFLVTLFAFTAGVASAQKKTNTVDAYYPLLRNTFVEANAYKTVAFVESRWHFPGNSGFNQSIFEVEKTLKKAGYKKGVNG